MKIKAAVVREKGGPFVIEDIELDEPRADEVLVRIASTGLCHTDLVARMQYLPIPLPGVFGHEGAGVVEKVGAQVAKVKPGDHVATSFSFCGACVPCKKGRPGWCTEFRRLNFSGRRADGSTTMKKGSETVYGSFFGQSTFASHALVNERNVAKVPSDVPVEILSPMGCGIQTGAGGVINTLQVKPGSALAVFGIGSVGLSAIMAAVVSGCTQIIGVDIMEERLHHLLRFELELWQQGLHLIAGVDEAGMAPLAGPVIAAAVILPCNYKLRGLDDSKKILDEQRREELADQIKQDAVCWSFGRAEVEEIDTLNIYHAGLLAMRRAVESLGTAPEYLLVDARSIPHCTCPQRGIVHGDALSASIAAASIIAKTTRDRHMLEMDRIYAGYGFASHKGYPTLEHLQALKERGPLPIHRRSFTPVRQALGLDPIQGELFPNPTSPMPDAGSGPEAAAIPGSF